ncbi:MAG TPA: hypothetical protein VHO46_00855 [Bacteroidales bacterium]|nr:hypothetical protein [Bacteroidales bacterium]
MKRSFFCLFLLSVLFSCEKDDTPEILKFYGDAYDDIGYSIASTGKGYLIAGQYTKILRTPEKGITGSYRKLALIETGSEGMEIRKDTTSSKLTSCGTKVITLDDGSSIVAGYIMNPGSSAQDIYVVKFAANGEGFTEKVYTLAGNQYANDIIKTPEGYLILGATDVERGSSDDTGNASGKKDILLLSINNNLDIIRYIPYGFTGNDEGVAIKADRSGGYVVVGTTDRYQSATGTDVFILSVNEDISNVSARSGRFIELANNQTAADFEVTTDGYFIAGNTDSEGSSKGYAWKITGTIWGSVEHHAIKFNDTEEAFTINSISPYKSNSFLMAGQYGSTTSGSMIIFATDMLGYPDEGKRRISGGTGNQVAYDVVADGDDIVAVGKNTYENNSMITLLKFRF